MRHAALCFLGMAVLLGGFQLAGQTPAASRGLFDKTAAELTRDFKDLSGVQFTADRGRLPALLRIAADQVSEMMGRSATFSATEEMHSMRFLVPGGFDSDQRSVFRYTVRVKPGNPGSLEESRRPIDAPGSGEDLLRPLLAFLPASRSKTQFRYLGRDSASDDVVLFAWAANAGSYEGFVWIDSEAKRVVRIRMEQPGVTIELRLNPALLPTKATVSQRNANDEIYKVHRFSEFRSNDEAGAAPAASLSDLDAREALVNGIVSLRNHKATDAVPVLRRAVTLSPEAAEYHYQLGVALHETHDLAGAEAEFRETVKRAPAIADGHNELGTVLFERGHAAGAAEQFREAARLNPQDASAHANAGEALLKAGDRPGALEEYRLASRLIPENAAVKSRYEQLQRDPAATPAGDGPSTSPDTTIRVDVRQVLVPVIVTDRGGHRATELRRTDFQVFEDGVEQSISSFVVEHSTTSVTPELEGPHPNAAAPPAPRARPVTNYLIGVDTMHASFGNFGRVRDALAKVFEREKPGDARYALVIIGNQPQILQQFTADPSQILAALDAHKFMGAITTSQRSSDALTLEDFGRLVEAARRSCDSPDPLERVKCDGGKRRLSLQAEGLAQRSQVSTVAFLRQLRALVEQLAQMPGRRTLVLLSDGFMMSPGRESFGLLATYFPEMRDAGLRGIERLQSDFDPVVRLAARYNVPIDSIDSRGLYAPTAFDASSHGSTSPLAAMSHSDDVGRESGNSLAELAAATGGLFIHNTNDLMKGVERVLADSRDCYVLAYVSKNATLDGKFRAIAVKVRDEKLTVRAKRGYWATEN